MEFSTENTKIIEALMNIKSEIGAILKTGKNTAQNYNYAKFEDYVMQLHDILVKNKTTIVTTMDSKPEYLSPRPSKSGSFQYPVWVGLTIRAIHHSGEWAQIKSYGEGQDTGDKGIYKAITGARKYGLALLFDLTTTDDPEKAGPQDSDSDTTSSENSNFVAKCIRLINDQKTLAELQECYELIKSELTYQGLSVENKQIIKNSLVSKKNKLELRELQ